MQNDNQPTGSWAGVQPNTDHVIPKPEMVHPAHEVGRAAVDSHHPSAEQRPIQPASVPHHSPRPPEPVQQPAQPAAFGHMQQPSLVGVDSNSNYVESVPVVKVWSVRGVEYAIMSFMLWFIAISVNWVIVALINGGTGFVELSPPLALLIVSLPAFAFFFLRLKKAELADPSLRTESTKRRFSQVTQIVSFAVSFFATLTIVAAVLASIGGEDVGLSSTVTSALAFIVVWGGLFAYYWRDEHRMSR